MSGVPALGVVAVKVAGECGQRVIDAVVMHSDEARRCSITTMLLQHGEFSMSPLGWLAPTLASTISMARKSYPVLLYVRLDYLLAGRLTKWAREQGLTDSGAVRQLLSTRLDEVDAPKGPVEVS